MNTWFTIFLIIWGILFSIDIIRLLTRRFVKLEAAIQREGHRLYYTLIGLLVAFFIEILWAFGIVVILRVLYWIITLVLGL